MSNKKPLNKAVFGVPEGIRTPDLLIRSQTLYPAELQAHMDFAANTKRRYYLSIKSAACQRGGRFFLAIFYATTLRSGFQMAREMP